jgi:hypothetical protein
MPNLSHNKYLFLSNLGMGNAYAINKATAKYEAFILWGKGKGQACPGCLLRRERELPIGSPPRELSGVYHCRIYYLCSCSTGRVERQGRDVIQCREWGREVYAYTQGAFV